MCLGGWSEDAVGKISAIISHVVEQVIVAETGAVKDDLLFSIGRSRWRGMVVQVGMRSNVAYLDGLGNLGDD